jgi:hypothetical protein
MSDESVFWNRAKRRTAGFLLGTALLSMGTPAVTALTQPGARFYLLQTVVFGAQIVPNLLAAGLWLPWRSAWANKAALWLAGVLFVASALFYLPLMTGIVPTTGDMIALSYIFFAMVTSAFIVIATIVGFGATAFLRRRRLSELPATNARDQK